MTGELILAVIVLGCPLLYVCGIRKVNLADMEPGIIDDRRDLVHMIVVIVREVNIKVIEMMIIQIIHQCVIFIMQTGVHEKRFAAAGDQRAVSPCPVGGTEIDRRDLHVSAGRLGRKCRNDGRAREENTE